MAEYIDKNKAIELIKELENIKDVSEAEEWVDIFISTINELPIIELKHGQWSEKHYCSNLTGYDYAVICSECEKPTYRQFAEPIPNYCPNCGAKMSGEENV